MVIFLGKPHRSREDVAVSLLESYAACRSITQERAKNFYYGIRLLPERRRDSLCACYAFFRISDDLSDDEAIANKDQRLEHWKALVRQSPENATQHPILPAFYDSIARYEIPHHYFEELLEGTTSDLTVTRYPTFEDTYRYCYQVASTVGLVCLHVFGFDHSPEALAQAEARGIAFQLTNILRDVAEDGQRGRIYLPVEDLNRFGVSVEEFLSGQPCPRLEALLAFQIERAKGYYDASSTLSQRVEKESRASLEAMTEIYRALLSKVESMGTRVFQERAKLSKLEKLSLAGKTALSGLKGR
jgi:phytoene synthase